MKDPVYRARCIDKVLSRHSGLEVVEGLADIALGVFQVSLKNEKENLSPEDIRRMIKELIDWRRTTSRS